MSNSRIRIVIASVLVGFALILGTTPAGAHAEKKVSTVTFTAVITSNQKVLYNAGVNNSLTYGWNRLVGTATVYGVLSDIEMLGNVDYNEGSGPFYGFVTITQPDATLALKMTGKATASLNRDSFSPGTETKFKSTLKVIGGSGRFIQAKGAGVWTGNRTAELGEAVTMKVKLKVSGLSH